MLVLLLTHLGSCSEFFKVATHIYCTVGLVHECCVTPFYLHILTTVLFVYTYSLWRMEKRE
jgi:hypothetical protein